MRIFCLIIGLILSVSTYAAGYPLQAGDTRYEMPLVGESALSLLTHRPEGIGADAPVLIVMHGNSRDADRYLHQWRNLSDQYGFFLLVPEFSQANYPKSRQYHLGNVMDKYDRLRARQDWSFSRIEQAFDFYRAQQGIQTNTYKLYGHSAGSQFVHRFLYHLPQSRATALVAANAGWYTMPDFDQVWPYGLKGSVVDEDDLQTALSRPLLVLLGEQDIDPKDKSLRRTPQALLQGPHRLARGQHFYRAAKAHAESIPSSFAWQLQSVPDVAHDNRGMAVAAARFLFAGYQ